MMIEEVLSGVGLSKNEVKIYLALIELGPSLIGKICGKTKIHRRNVYDSIEMLKNKGFVSSTVMNNRNVFEAVAPTRILDLLDEKKTDVQKILPKLLSKQSKKQCDVRVYTGLSGIKIIFEDKLKCKEDQYVLGAHKPAERISLFVENYHKRRIKDKIHLKMLFANNQTDSARKFNKYRFVQARLMPEKFNAPIAINIYGSKVALLLASNTLEPISIMIEDKEFSDNFKTYFNMIWELSKPV